MKADQIIKKYELLMERLSSFNDKIGYESYDRSAKVSEFLNESSPSKGESLRRNSDGLIMLDSDTSDGDRGSIKKK